jgi:plastocyanin
MKNKNFFLALILLLFLVFACAPEQPEAPPPTQLVPSEGVDKEKIVEKVVVEEPKGTPTLTIVAPKDSELIKSSKVTVELKTNNFNIVPIGEPVKEGEGHFHIWLDSDKKITVDNIVTFENVVSGKHTIVAELLKSDHSSLSPKVTKTITINVESDYVPPKLELQQGIAEFTVEADDNGFYPNKIQAKVGDKVKINFKFRDNAIYFAGLDIKGPFPDIKYKLKGEQPLTAEFTMKEETKITSWWPASGVKKATLTVEVAK